MRPALYDLGIFPILTLTSADVRAFTAADVAELRDLGATDGMLDELRELARVPDRRLRLDFELRTVAIE
jgi:hypothetical protein